MQHKGQVRPHKKERREELRATASGESVHFDFVGPLEVERAHKNKWILDGVDDYDGWCESYPM
jgi:hypothetical protein